MGHHSALVILRDHGLGVLVATNSERGAPHVNAVAWRALSLAIQAKTGQPLPPGPQMDPVQPARSASSRVEDSWQGHFSTVFGDVVTHTRRNQVSLELFGRKLFLRPIERGGMGLWAKALGLFDVQPGDMKLQRVDLVRVASREVIVRTTPGGRQLMGLKYRPVAADASWRSRVGYYRPRQSAREYRLVPGMEIIEAPQGQLLVRPIVDVPIGGPPPSSALHIVDETWAVTEGVGRNNSVWIAFDSRGRLHMNGLVLERSARGPESCYGRMRSGPRFKGRRDLCY